MLLFLAVTLILSAAAAVAEDFSNTLLHLRRSENIPEGATSAPSSAAPSNKFTYRRRNQATETNVIFGITLEEIALILTSDVADEFGSDELGIERAQELWEEYADFELAQAMTAEEDYLAGRDGATLSEAIYPYLLCSKKEGKSGTQRKEQIIDIVRYSIDPEDLTPEQLDLVTASSIYTVYNGEAMSCFGARATASVALIFAALQDPELPILPIHSYLKIRSGSVQEMLRRAFPVYEANATVDESFESTDTISSSTTLLEAHLCAGVSDDELNSMGDKVVSFMRAKKTNRTESLLSSSSRYADVPPEDHDALPTRVLFWLEVFRLGIDSEEGCNSTLEGLSFEVMPGNSTGETLGFYIYFGPPTENTSTTTVACALSLIAGIALRPQVCSIELNPLVSVSNVEARFPGTPRSRRDNDNAQWILQDYRSQERPFWSAGITGKGQVIGVSDSGLDTDHCNFWDSSCGLKKDGSTDTSCRKVVQYEPYVDDKDDKGGHGTHVCGTIVGHKAEDGNTESTGLIDGVAKDAKVAFFDAGGGGDSLTIPGDKSRFLGVGTSAGAKIHSSSWGSWLSPPKYDTMSHDIDQYIFEDWNFLLIVAAGNEGAGNREKSIMSPAVGKNVLTVGASQSTTDKGIEYLADFSSRGPTSDGRIKPDVVAPGQKILSANANPDVVGECGASGVIYMQGTSMATPATSGAAALVRQYFLDGHYPSRKSIDPSGMLLKAVLINGAQEISYIDNLMQTPTVYYDNNQGFGRVSLIDSLPLQGSNNFNASFIDRGSIQDGQTVELQVNITKSGGCMQNQMRVTLVWADPPGASGCTRCLVNDLDLSVMKNSDPTVYYPNGRSNKDSTNNVERIIVDAEDGDKMFIKIHAANLDRADQAFALIITGCIEARDYEGEAEPQGHSNKRRNIIIIVCCVIGGILLLGLGWVLCTR